MFNHPRMKSVTVCLIYSWLIQLWSVILCVLLATAWSAKDTSSQLQSSTTFSDIYSTPSTTLDYNISVRGDEPKCSFTQLPPDGISVVRSMVSLLANDSNALWWRDCELLCCWTAQCRLVLLTESTCLLLSCRSPSIDQCVQVQRSGHSMGKSRAPLYPHSFSQSSNLSESSATNTTLDPTSEESSTGYSQNNLCSLSYRPSSSTTPTSVHLPTHSSSKSIATNVDVFVDKCGASQTCAPLFWRHRARNIGLCRCFQPRHVRDPESGRCVAVPISGTLHNGAPVSVPTSLRLLNVSVANVSVLAALSGASSERIILSANVVGSDVDNTTLQFSWSPVSTQSSATVQGHSSLGDEWDQPRLQLPPLPVGVHLYMVEVFGPRNYGNTIASVTVHTKKSDLHPVAIISPIEKTFLLPTNNSTATIVLDGSQSYSIAPGYSTEQNTSAEHLHYSWYLDASPAEFQLTGQSQLLTADKIQLKRLVAGNYSVRLLVTSDGGGTNSTVTNFTVLPPLLHTKLSSPPSSLDTDDDETYHQPVTISSAGDNDDGDGRMKRLRANAGPDLVLYFPSVNITLNGSSSDSANGVVSYRWTRGAIGMNTSLLMQDGGGGVLNLSLLEVGVYSFVLHVKDGAGNTASDTVAIEVKRRPFSVKIDSPVNVTLPRSWTILEAIGNSDSLDSLQWLWNQISGPSQVIIQSSNLSRVNVTGLMEGHYLFGVSAWNDLTNGSAQVVVNVLPATNQRPLVDAGGNLTVQLPISVVTLNGSRTHDDSPLIGWNWSRDPESPAAGDVIGGSDSSSVLQLVNLAAGCYRFTLTVTDRDGLKGHDTVQVNVLADPNIRSRVTIELQVDFDQVRWSQRQLLIQRISHLLTATNSCQLINNNNNSSVHVQLLGWSRDRLSGQLVVELRAACVPDSLRHRRDGEATQYISAETIVQQIKSVLDNSPLGWSRLPSPNTLSPPPLPGSPPLVYLVNRVYTSVCVNRCSERGECVAATRLCQCRTFWLENPIRVYFGDGQRNCDWSLLYVIIIGFSCLTALTVGCWLLAVLLRRHFSCWRYCLPMWRSRDTLSTAGSSGSFKPAYRPLQHPIESVQMVNKARYSKDTSSNSRLISRHTSNAYSSSTSGSDNDSEPLFETAGGQNFQHHHHQQQQQKSNRRLKKAPHLPHISHKRRLRLNGSGANKQV